MMNDALTLLDETGRWRARDVRYMEGTWDRIKRELPEFAKVAFRATADGPANPHLQSVIRLPRTAVEQPIPVGVVSNTYTLAQHKFVAEKCIDGVAKAGIEIEGLRCQVGLSELGEWMNFRIYFPKTFDLTPADGNDLGLRIECFNSVDGSSRLIILLGWLRFVCSNGLVIGETKAELRDVHDQHMNLDKIPEIILKGLEVVDADRSRIAAWENSEVALGQIATWANEVVPKTWGVKAASRAFHICATGFDVEFEDPFAKGTPTEKPVTPTTPVPGAPSKATSLYDVSQALSWIASTRPNSIERVNWQSQIAGLVDQLGAMRC